MDLHIPTAQMIHDVVRAQLPELSSRVSGMYGDVYGRAWKGATPEFALVIQERIQEFLFAAIHSRRESTFKSVRAFMASVQSQRDQLEKAILGVYGPILWRALKCSHAVVRLHALTLFFDAFPLLVGQRPLHGCCGCSMIRTGSWGNWG
jgi:phage major head subunit gpT-like protein